MRKSAKRPAPKSRRLRFLLSAAGGGRSGISGVETDTVSLGHGDQPPPLPLVYCGSLGGRIVPVLDSGGGGGYTTTTPGGATVGLIGATTVDTGDTGAVGRTVLGRTVNCVGAVAITPVGLSGCAGYGDGYGGGGCGGGVGGSGISGVGIGVVL